MKKSILLKILPLFLIVVALVIVNSCKDSLVLENEEEELALKSAGIEKQSYIVVLSDNEINEQLSKIKGYKKKQDVMNSAVAKILKRNGITDATPDFVYSTAILGFSVKIPPGQLKKLQDDPSVKYVEKDKIISLNPLINKDPIHITKKPVPPPPDQEVPWGITRVGGGVTYTGLGTVWVIDSGIDLDHPDLNVDVDRSITYVPRTTSADDQNGHGTHVAGTIAAINDGIGVVGVAAGASVVAVRVLDRKGSGTTTSVIAGVDYVADNGIAGDVANMSLGGEISTTLDTAVLNASSVVKFALAAGNEEDDAENHSPARVDGQNIYTVSAMDSNDYWAYFSNYGDHVDYCAPGVGIYSCYKGGTYKTLSGTSMAAPHVAGILLLGNISTDGTVNNDPDGNPDPIAVH